MDTPEGPRTGAPPPFLRLPANLWIRGPAVSPPGAS